MVGIYWYVSRQKIEALCGVQSTRGLGWLKDISIKLKGPFVEAGATLAPDQSLFKNVERLARSLLKSPETPVFPELAGRDTMFFSFSGHAQRAVDSGAYWIAMLAGSTALLLGGSVENAIGGQTMHRAENISPSVDPIGAVTAAFEQTSPDHGMGIGQVCSYVWATITTPVHMSWHTLPFVEGIAAYGGAFPATRSDFDNIGFAGVEQIVVASPIYVRQVK